MLDGPHYYDIDGSPLELMEWAAKFEARLDDPQGDWRIGEDVSGDVRVSTVWMGLDHNWLGGPPHIFESMVFGGALDGETYRYSTKEDAAAGHARLVALVQAEHALTQ